MTTMITGTLQARMRREADLAEKYGAYLKGKNVVLVGPAASLLGRKQGAKIDAYDVIVRLNLASPVPQELYEDIGSRTDVLYHVLFNPRLARASGQFHSIQQVAEWKRDGVKHLVTRQEVRHDRVTRFERATKYTMPILTMPREIKEEIKRETGTNPNTGTVAITHLLSFGLKSLFVTGFDFYATGYYPGYGQFNEEQAAKGVGGFGGWGQTPSLHVPHKQDTQKDYLVRLFKADGRLKFDDIAAQRLGLVKRGKGITALIPIKAHSERVQGKNTRPMAGKPMLSWLLGALQEATHIHEVVVDTDSYEIAELIRTRHPRTTVIMRPPELWGDHVVGNDLIAWELTQVKGEHFGQFHVTSPLLTPGTIDKAVESYFVGLRKKKHDSMFAVTKHHFWLFRKDGTPLNSDTGKLVRSQDLEPLFEDNNAMHFFSRKTFAETQSRIGRNPGMFEIGRIEATDIDWEEDFAIAEALLEQRMRHA